MALKALQLLVSIVPPLMKAFGFKDDQIEKFLVWVKSLQDEAPRATIAADEEARARAALIERIKREQGNGQ